MPVTVQPPLDETSEARGREAGRDGSQAGATVRFEWGAAGARDVTSGCAAVVVVDVLSFTTTAAIAASFATEVLPCVSDEDASRLAASTGAQLAVPRHEADADHPWSLSPASITGAVPGGRLVLPSPNGSAISAELRVSGMPVLAACLRNAGAVASWLVDRDLGRPRAPVAVIAAGERWADGSLRPAIEDLFAAGLVLDELVRAGGNASAETSAAVASVLGLPPARLADLVRASTSGTELRVAGYAEDVEIAVAIGTDDVVPVMWGDSLGFQADRRRRAEGGP